MSDFLRRIVERGRMTVGQARAGALGAAQPGSDAELAIPEIVEEIEAPAAPAMPARTKSPEVPQERETEPPHAAPQRLANPESQPPPSRAVAERESPAALPVARPPVLRGAGIRSVEATRGPVPQISAPESGPLVSRRVRENGAAVETRRPLAAASPPERKPAVRREQIERWEVLKQRLHTAFPPQADKAEPVEQVESPRPRPQHGPARRGETAVPPAPGRARHEIPAATAEGRQVVIRNLEVTVRAEPHSPAPAPAAPRAVAETRSGAWDAAARRYLGRL